MTKGFRHGDSSLLRATLAAALCLSGTALAQPQLPIARIQEVPDTVGTYQMRDWRSVALGFDQLVFDTDATGEHFPLVRIDPTPTFPGAEAQAFGLAAYVGETRTFGETGEPVHEAIASLPAVLGATLVGVDKSAGLHNYVSMSREYFGGLRGHPVMLNTPHSTSGHTAWYETAPSILFYSIAEHYPDEAGLPPVLDAIDDAFYNAVRVMTDSGANPNFNHTAFNFAAQQPTFNGVFREPDMGLGMAWLQHAAYARNKDADPARAAEHLQAVGWALSYYDQLSTNPDYEMLTPFGVYTAARMNAEHGRNHDIHKMINWVFDRSDARPDKIMVTGTWGGQEVNGLMGFIRPNTPDTRGYAFAMNTFAAAMPMVPLVRYEDRYAGAIGKWMLHAASAARLFYADQHTAANQSSEHWAGDPGAVIPYEGLRHRWNHPGEELFAGGDPLVFGWGPETDFALYGGAYAGVFGSIIRETDVPQILELDLLATDAYRDEAFPTHLYYNPYDQERTVTVQLGDEPMDLYDAASNQFLAREARGDTAVQVPGQSPVILVRIPVGQTAERDGRALRVGGVVVDHNATILPGNLLANPDVDLSHPGNPNRPANWHYSLSAGWTDTIAQSPGHALALSDNTTARSEEWRSYAAAVPDGLDRELVVRWFVQHHIAAGDEFVARIRVSTAPVSGLDLVGQITDFVFPMTGSTDGFEMHQVAIPLDAGVRSFDITFITGGGDEATGVMWVDDISAAVGVRGDVNGDGFVGAADLDVLLGRWNRNDGAAAEADLNGDGFIGAADLDILLGDWNAGSAPGPAALVLEPAGAGALLLAGTGLLGRRRLAGRL